MAKAPDGSETPPEGAQQFKPVQVEVDGKTVEFTPGDAVTKAVADGYMLQKDYTQKTMDLANQRRELEARGSARPGSGPDSLWDDSMEPSERQNTPADAGGGLFGDDAEPPQQRRGQPAQAPSRPRAPLDDGDLEEPVVRAEWQALKDELVGMTRAEVAKVKREFARKDERRRAETNIGAMEQTLPGFSRAAIEAQLARMGFEAPDMLSRLRKMPQDAAYELLYHRLGGTGQAVETTPQTGPAPQGQAAPGPATVFAEGQRRAPVPQKSAPTLAPGGSREALIERGLALGELMTPTEEKQGE